MSLQFLSAPTEFPGTLPLSIGHLLEPRLCLAKDAFILSPLSWAIMTKTNLSIHQHSLFWRRLLLLGQIFVLGLGHRPNKQVDNELLGPNALQKPLEILFSGSSGRNEDFDVSILALCSCRPTSAYEDTFLTTQGTLLVLRHSRHVFIKFLRLSVPHVLRRDANPTIKGFAGNRAGIFPLSALSLV